MKKVYTIYITINSMPAPEYYSTQGGATVHTDDMLSGRKWAESCILLFSSIFDRYRC